MKPLGQPVAQKHTWIPEIKRPAVDVIKVTTAVSCLVNVIKHLNVRRKPSRVIITRVSFTPPLAAYGVRRTACGVLLVPFMTSTTGPHLQSGLSQITNCFDSEDNTSP